MRALLHFDSNVILTLIISLMLLWKFRCKLTTLVEGVNLVRILQLCSAKEFV